MNQLNKVFDGQDLTIIENEGKPLFLLKDVCKILELGQVAGVKRRLDKDVISNHPLETSGGIQLATYVNEDGLYDVVLDSRKPEAKQFRKWITSEVVPSIRETGSYEQEQKEQSSTKSLLLASLEHENRLEDMEEDVSYLKDTMRIDSRQEGIIQNKAKSVIVESLGGKNSHAYETMNRKVFSRFWSEFKRYFVVPRYGDIPKNQFENAIEWINEWQPDTSTRMEIKEANKQMSMEDDVYATT